MTNHSENELRTEALYRLANRELNLPAELLPVIEPPDDDATTEAAQITPLIDAIVDDLTTAWGPAIAAAMKEQP